MIRALQEQVIVGLANHTVLIAQDGTERPIDDSAAPIRERSGTPIGAVLVFRDVTERKRAEESQSRLAAIVQSSDDAIISKTLDGIIRTWNDSAERLFGYTSVEAVGQSITLIIPLERLDEERHILQRLRRGERIEHFDTVRMAKDGRLLDVSLTISPLRDPEGRIIGVSKVARDITQRKEAEAALRRSEERYRTLFESMGQGFCLIEMLYDGDVPVDYRFLEVNPAFEIQSGFKDVIGRTLRELVPNHDAHWFGVFARVATTGEPMRFVTEAKAMGRWFDVSAYRPGGSESDRVGILVTDITERKHTEEAIRQRDERIQLFLGNATDYAVIICDSEDRVVEWLGGAENITGWRAHEVEGKSADIIFTPQDRAAKVPEMVMKLGAGDTNVVMQTRTIMERQLSHMVRLVDDLLDVSRISRNKMELRRARVLLADVVANAVETARPLIDASEHNLFVTLPPDSIYLDADITRLAQVFSNLLSNSAKYTPHGGNIWLTAERRGEEAVISVRDDGIGIPHESLSSIFDMFSQVDRSIERSTGGLGIGLALVKGLVEMHGGSVQAECTEPGRGSTFTVTLPLQQNRASLEGHPRPLDGPSGDGVKWRVLVVDDNKDSANSMSMMLKLVGNEVRTANDGVEALRVGEEFRPEVILMDVGMPKLNGYEATRCIRERQWGRAIIVIALTGWGQEADRIQSRNAGCDGHLVKPVSLTELQELLSKLNSETGNRGWKKC